MADRGVKIITQTCGAAGRIGGLTRARNLTPEERTRIARLAAKARWARKSAPDPTDPDDGGLHATIGGAVEYRPGGGVEDHSRYSVKRSKRKSPQKVSDSVAPGASHAA